MLVSHQGQVKHQIRDTHLMKLRQLSM